MKLRKLVYFGGVLVVAASLVSCLFGSSDPLDLSKYDEITKDEALEIIDNFDPEAAWAEVETIIYESYLAGLETEVHIDSRSDSYYYYMRQYDSTSGESAYLLVTGSGDSYMAYAKDDTEEDQEEVSATTIGSFITLQMNSIYQNVVYDPTILTLFETYDEEYVMYGTYSDCLLIQYENETAVGEEASLYENAYVIYTTGGLLRCMSAEILSTIGEEQIVTLSTYMSFEYNPTISKKTSLD